MIILFVGTVIMSWTMFSARLTNAEQKITELQQVVNSINQINIDIAVIKTQLVIFNSKLK